LLDFNCFNQKQLSIMKKYIFIFFIVFLACAFTGKSYSNKLFPAVKGWKLEINETVYNASTLWEYIDGAAEIYLAYDFQNLYLAKYAGKDESGVRAEIYEHSSPVNAFGIYTAERMPDYNFVDIGVQGYTEPGILNFYTGEYYVKLMSSGPTETDKATLMIIATEISNTIGNTENWPLAINYFPPEGKVPNTERYIAKNFLGYSFFHSAFTAEYYIGEKYQMFVIDLKNEKEVQDMLNSYINILNEEKVMQENDFYAIDDFFNGMLFILVKSGCIAGVINMKDRALAEELLNKVKL